MKQRCTFQYNIFKLYSVNAYEYLHLYSWRLLVYTRIKNQFVLRPVIAHIKLQSSGKRRSVVWLIDRVATVSQEFEACIFREEASTWGQGVPPKRQYVSPKLLSFAAQEAIALANEKCLDFYSLTLFSLHFLPRTQNAHPHNQIYDLSACSFPGRRLQYTGLYVCLLKRFKWHHVLVLG